MCDKIATLKFNYKWGGTRGTANREFPISLHAPCIAYGLGGDAAGGISWGRRMPTENAPYPHTYVDSGSRGLCSPVAGRACVRLAHIFGREGAISVRSAYT